MNAQITLPTEDCSESAFSRGEKPFANSNKAFAVRLRQQFLPEVKPLFKGMSLMATLLQLSTYIGSAIFAAIGAESLRGSDMYPIAAGVTIIFIGSRFRALGNVVHECAHGTALPSPRWNEVLGHLISFFDFSDFVQYRREHRTHHAHLADPVRDLDFARLRSYFIPRHSFLVQHVLKPLTLFHLPTYFTPVFWSKNDRPVVRMARFTVLLALLGIAQFLIGWRCFLCYYLVPYATWYQIIRYWSDAADHAGIDQSDDELYRSRNHIFGFLVNWVVFPRNDHYHLVHHLFPSLPTKSLGKVHGILMRNAAYAALNHSGRRLVLAKSAE